MQLNKLQQAKDLEKDILEQKDLLENVKKLLPKDSKNVTVKIRGTEFELPAKLFTAQLKGKVKTMEDDIVAQEQELTNL